MTRRPLRHSCDACSPSGALPATATSQRCTAVRDPPASAHADSLRPHGHDGRADLERAAAGAQALGLWGGREGSRRGAR
eukprot:3746386-Alexandrium_andersonii.AAC.1